MPRERSVLRMPSVMFDAASAELLLVRWRVWCVTRRALRTTSQHASHIRVHTSAECSLSHRRTLDTV